MKQSTNTMGTAVTLGAGVVALAAASYFFLGPKGRKNQRRTRGWMIKMKGDVVEKLESMQDITKDTYDTIVDTVSETYTTVADSKDEVAKLAKELKSHWKSISSKVMQEKEKKVTKKARKNASL
jgi:gas vesicle protein